MDIYQFNKKNKFNNKYKKKLNKLKKNYYHQKWLIHQEHIQQMIQQNFLMLVKKKRLNQFVMNIKIN